MRIPGGLAVHQRVANVAVTMEIYTEVPTAATQAAQRSPVAHFQPWTGRLHPQRHNRCGWTGWHWRALWQAKRAREAAVEGATVAAVAAVISFRQLTELVSTHGETSVTVRLVPFTVDGLILAASMLVLDANRRSRPVPPPARWCRGAGIGATIGANLAHGLGHGPIGALVSALYVLAGRLTFSRQRYRRPKCQTPDLQC